MCVDKETRNVIANQIDAFRYGEISADAFIDSLEGFLSNDRVFEDIVYMLNYWYQDCGKNYYFSRFEDDPGMIAHKHFLERCSRFLRTDYVYRYVESRPYRLTCRHKIENVLSFFLPQKFPRHEDPIDRILSGPWPFTEEQLQDFRKP